MVNLVEAQRPILHGLMKMAGLRPQMVEVEPGTVMSFWVPKKKKNKGGGCHGGGKVRKEKPAVVLIHGFAAEGIMTWQFQVGALTRRYSVYVPDLLFFGGSTTRSADRSTAFQAECLGRALGLLGVGRCAVVGFSYGGMVAFKLTEARPEMVGSLVVSGSVFAVTDSISEENLARMGFSSYKELLLPDSIEGNRALLSIAAHRKYWVPECFHRDYIKAMFNNRKEKAELLDGVVVSNKDATVPTNLPQRILLLWGENDQIFKIELAKDMKEQLGEKATLQTIKKAGHLVHLERPCVYNRTLKEFLALVHAEGAKSSDAR